MSYVLCKLYSSMTIEANMYLNMDTFVCTIAKRIVHNSYNVINMCIDTEVTGRAFAVWRGVERIAVQISL